MVEIAGKAEAFRNAIVANEVSPILYNSVKPKEIMDEDKVIQHYKIKLKPEDAVITPVGRIFQ